MHIGEQLAPPDDVAGSGEGRPRDAAALATLLEVSRRLATRPTLDALFEEIVASVVTAIPNAEAASLWLVEGGGGFVSPVAWHGHPGSEISRLRIPVDASLVGKTLRSPNPVFVAEAQHDPDFAEVGSDLDSVRSIVGVRLTRESEVLGLLFADSYTKGDAFLPRSGEFLQALADIAAIALENALLVTRLKEVPVQIYKAEEAERKRLAYEVHDHIGSSLTAIHLGLSSHLEERPDELLEATRAQVARLVDDVRDLSLELRPTSLDAFGLEAALIGHLERFEETSGIEIIRDIEVPERPRLNPDVESAAFRFVQEALTNVARHAEATTVKVVARAGKHELFVCVQDDGRGVRPSAGGPSRGLGLDGMRERVSSVNGTFALWSEEGAGVTVEARIPIA